MNSTRFPILCLHCSQPLLHSHLDQQARWGTAHHFQCRQSRQQNKLTLLLTAQSPLRRHRPLALPLLRPPIACLELPHSGPLLRLQPSAPVHQHLPLGLHLRLPRHLLQHQPLGLHPPLPRHQPRPSAAAHRLLQRHSSPSRGSLREICC